MKGYSAQMSGRKGLYVNADTVLETLTKRVYDESKSRNENLSESELQNIADIVAVGTIRYEMIKPDLDKIITFDLNPLSRTAETADITIVDNVTRAMKLLVTESKNEGKKSIKYNNKKNLKLSILEIRKNLERRAKNA